MGFQTEQVNRDILYEYDHKKKNKQLDNDQPF